MNGKFVIVSGPSGSGKSTLISKFLKENSGFAFPVSATTRSPRQGEQDGIHYHFLTREDFEKRIEAGEFLEYANVYENLYGTLRSTVLTAIEEGKKLIKDVDVQGALQLMERLPKERRLTIFVMPPDLEELRNRLKGRGSETDESFSRRMDEALREIECRDRFDRHLINDDLDECCRRLKEMLTAGETTSDINR